MPKEHVRQSLERDAYLARNDDKQASREQLHRSIERLSKLMSLSSQDKAELLLYADQLLEHRQDGEKQEKESQVRRRALQARAAQQNAQEPMPPASLMADGAQASD